MRAAACREILSLLSDPANPDWEQTWSTKCDLKLEPCALRGGPHQATANPALATGAVAHAIPTAPLSPTELRRNQLHRNQLRSFLVGISPDQLPHDHKDGPRRLPDLTSILFNPKACASIQGSSKCDSRDGSSTFIDNLRAGKTGELRPGSIIAKAIWGIIPIDSSGVKPQSGISIYASKTTNDSEGTINDATEVPKIPSSTVLTQGKIDPSWAPYPFQPNDIHFDGACVKMLITPIDWTVPCTHGFSFNAAAPAPSDQAAIDQIESPAIGQQTVFASNCGRYSCQVILMGIHFMIREGETDPRRAGVASTGHWRFVTLWWNGKDNHLNLPEPWKYYDLRVTEDPRNDAIGLPTGTGRNVIYNPYLEGQETNGSRSNCINCHRYAAFGPAKTAADLKACAIGTTMGRADFPLPPGAPPVASTCGTIAQYQKSTTPTDQVWSFANFIIALNTAK
jgi:hypothetical protein